MGFFSWIVTSKLPGECVTLSPPSSEKQHLSSTMWDRLVCLPHSSEILGLNPGLWCGISSSWAFGVPVYPFSMKINTQEYFLLKMTLNLLYNHPNTHFSSNDLAARLGEDLLFSSHFCTTLSCQKLKRSTRLDSVFQLHNRLALAKSVSFSWAACNTEVTMVYLGKPLDG